jgi:hypothetical protein
MDRRWVAISVIALLLSFSLGFKVSFDQGIQPGYFEKAEAPAYGTGGGGGLGVDLDKATEEYFKNLLKDDDEE